MPSGEDTSHPAPSFAELLADTVRERRRSLGLRQAELADLAGCSQRFVHTVENGKPSLRMDKLMDLLEVLGLELRLVRRGEAEGGARDGALAGDAEP